jgi:hypothetical protein
MELRDEGCQIISAQCLFGGSYCLSPVPCPPCFFFFFFFFFFLHSAYHNCLSLAGLCVQDEIKRNAIISLIDACEARTGWPMATLRSDLRAEWAKVG